MLQLVEMLGILWASGASHTLLQIYTTIIITGYVPTGKIFQQVTEVIMVLSKWNYQKKLATER